MSYCFNNDMYFLLCFDSKLKVKMSGWCSHFDIFTFKSRSGQISDLLMYLWGNATLRHYVSVYSFTSFHRNLIQIFIYLIRFFIMSEKKQKRTNMIQTLISEWIILQWG